MDDKSFNAINDAVYIYTMFITTTSSYKWFHVLYRYNITPDGDLVIRDVSYTDVGTYQCYAKNKFGEKSAFGSLDVKSK